MNKNEILALLNAETPLKRIENLKMLLAQEKEAPEVRPQYANNHIHTIYSFSPYSPTAAIYFARQAGLQTAGIMDHDSISGAAEFRQAGKAAGVATTCGLECRINFDETPLKGRKTNNPDQDGVSYMTIHSVPPEHYSALQAIFAPLVAARNERNRKMVANINREMAPFGISIDFDKDVVHCSQFAVGGSITERHLTWALAGKIIEYTGEDGVVPFLQDKLGFKLSPKLIANLEGKEHLQYDILGVLKSSLIERIFVPATDECLTLSQVSAIAKKYDAILCYAYLGDVGESVTGDKKAEKYEDSYLEELFDVLSDAGVPGVTYMPSRNTEVQIARLREQCRRHGIREISGEDINSPRQGFICEKLAEPGFTHLVDAAWELVRREERD